MRDSPRGFGSQAPPEANLDGYEQAALRCCCYEHGDWPDVHVLDGLPLSCVRTSEPPTVTHLWSQPSTSGTVIDVARNGVGGRRGFRTPDLQHVKLALSQLS